MGGPCFFEIPNGVRDPYDYGNRQRDPSISGDWYHYGFLGSNDQ